MLPDGGGAPRGYGSIPFDHQGAPCANGRHHRHWSGTEAEGGPGDRVGGGRRPGRQSSVCRGAARGSGRGRYVDAEVPPRAEARADRCPSAPHGGLTRRPSGRLPDRVWQDTGRVGQDPGAGRGCTGLDRRRAGTGDRHHPVPVGPSKWRPDPTSAASCSSGTPKIQTARSSPSVRARWCRFTGGSLGPLGSPGSISSRGESGVAVRAWPAKDGPLRR